MATRFTGRGNRAPRRKMLWLDFAQVLQQPASVAAGTAVLLSPGLNAAGLALRPFTIVRTRGFIWAGTDQVAATETAFGAMGMLVAKDPAMAAGVGSLPTPTTETNAEFLVYQPFVTAIQFTAAAAYQNPAGNVFQFDSKAQRKVGIDEDMGILFENESAGSGAIVVLGGRCLIKLH